MLLLSEMLILILLHWNLTTFYLLFKPVHQLSMVFDGFFGYRDQGAATLDDEYKVLSGLHPIKITILVLGGYLFPA